MAKGKNEISKSEYEEIGTGLGLDLPPFDDILEASSQQWFWDQLYFHKVNVDWSKKNHGVFLTEADGVDHMYRPADDLSSVEQ